MQKESKSRFEQRLFDEYFEALVRLADARIGRRHGRVADGEDIAISAMGSFLNRYGDDSQIRLQEADSLWALIAKIAHRKALNHIRQNNRIKRGEGKIGGDSAFANGDEDIGGISSLPGDQHAPDVLAQSAETTCLLLSQLTPEMATIAQRKLEGSKNPEIAAELGCSVATIERRLKMIRSVWQQHLP